MQRGVRGHSSPASSARLIVVELDAPSAEIQCMEYWHGSTSADASHMTTSCLLLVLLQVLIVGA